MTTNQYRGIVAGQIVAMFILGLLSLSIILGAAPSCRSKRHLNDAIRHYHTGTEASLRRANESLEYALGVDPDMPGALALRGRIAIEQGDQPVARASYEHLQQLPSNEVMPGLADDGLGNVKLLQAIGDPGQRNTYLAEAYERFQEAIEVAPDDDSHVSAGICSLHQGNLVQAARHLREVRANLRLSYDSLTPYYAALGVLFATAADQPVRHEVARAYDDTDSELATLEGMLARSIVELEKAVALAENQLKAPELNVIEALVKANALVSAEYDRERAGPYRTDIIRALRSYGPTFARHQRRFLHLALAVAWVHAGHGRNAHQAVRSALNEVGPDEVLPAEEEFFVGSLQFRASELIKDAPREGDVAKQLRDRAREHLQSALDESPDRPPLDTELRFWAYAQLAVLWRDDDPARALEYATAGEEIIRDQSRLAAREERAKFFRNIGILQFLNQEREAARTSIARALALGDDAEDLEAFDRGMRIRRVVLEDIRAVPPQQLIEQQAPPTIPVVSVRIRHEQGVRVDKSDFLIYIGDELAVGMRWGRDGRLYARARFPVPPDEEYEVRVVQRVDGEELELARESIMLTYEHEIIEE